MKTDEFLEAIRKDDNQKIEKLLQTQPSLANTKDHEGVSAIFLALYRGNGQAAREIAAKKTDIDVYEAAALGNLSRLRTLLDQDKALANSFSTDGFTALALAAYLGQKETTLLLLKKGADPNALARNQTGFTPLTGAVSQNHNEVARLLVNHGANVNHKYEGGFTPIMHAAHAGNFELVKLLLDNGADPNAKNGEEKTALTFAREKNHDKVVALLQSRGAA